ncbi:MAG: hypothetical protein DRP85_09235 [Candidatus Makaraimicrobium thalassicum]|nr:MAG: hypothetical protein DRP85_09235 [Candidatus Omnitrophota bacterium]
MNDIVSYVLISYGILVLLIIIIYYFMNSPSYVTHKELSTIITAVASSLFALLTGIMVAFDNKFTKFSGKLDDKIDRLSDKFTTLTREIGEIKVDLSHQTKRRKVKRQNK